MTQKVQATSEIGVNDLYMYTQMHRSYNSLVSHKFTMISCCKLTSNKTYVWVILQVTTTPQKAIGIHVFPNNDQEKKNTFHQE